MKTEYTTVKTQDERGKWTWCIRRADGSLARAASQYRGDAGRIRKFRTQEAAEVLARHVSPTHAALTALRLT